MHKMLAQSSLQKVLSRTAVLGTHAGARLAVMRIVLKPMPASAYFVAAAYIIW